MGGLVRCNRALGFYSLQCPNQGYTAEAGERHVPQIIDKRPQNRLLPEGGFDHSIHAPGGFCRTVGLRKELRQLRHALLQIMRSRDQVTAQLSSMELLMTGENCVNYRNPDASADISQQIEESASVSDFARLQPSQRNGAEGNEHETEREAADDDG